MDCEVKRQLTKEGMVSMIKQRQRADAMIDLFKREGRSTDEAISHTFKLQVLTPHGIVETEQKVSELLESTRHLETLQAQCRKCPLRIDGMYDALFSGTPEMSMPICCYNGINYPISRKAEEWLAEMVKDALAKGGARTMVLDYIKEKRITGHEFSKLRARDNRFLELTKPLSIVSNNGIFNKNAINTDQILTMLFGYPCVDRGHMVMILCLAGALDISDHKPDGKSCQLLISMRGKDGGRNYWSFNLEDHESDDRSIIQIKDFFRLIFLACILGHNITVDR